MQVICLIDFFIAARTIFQLFCGCHHYRLDLHVCVAHVAFAVRVLFHAIHVLAATRDLFRLLPRIIRSPSKDQ
jgi:hypothetical protein